MSSTKKRAAKNPQKIKIEEKPMLLGEEQAAYIAGVSLSYLRKSRCQGVLKHSTPPPPFVRVGKRVFYPQSKLIA